MDTGQRKTPQIREFERSLKGLIADAFAEGVPIEGTWGVELSSNVSGWKIEISKQPPEDPEYIPEFIEE